MLKMRSKYALAMFFLILAMVPVLSGILLWRFNLSTRRLNQYVSEVLSNSLTEELEKRGESIARLLVENLVNPLYFRDMQSLYELLATVRSMPGIRYVYVYDTNGRIIHDGTKKVDSLDSPIANPVTEGAIAFKGRIAKQITGDILDISLPIWFDDVALGGFKIGLDASTAREQQSALENRIALIQSESLQENLFFITGVTLFLMLFGVLLSVMLAGRIVRPVKELARLAAIIGKGDYQVDMPPAGKDEVGALVTAFERMKTDLKERTISIDVLEKLVSDRTHALSLTNKELKKEVGERRKSEKELTRYQEELEKRIEERTLDLKRSNQRMQEEIDQRRRSDKMRKKMEKQLVRAQKMEAIGTLAAGVAHDLNNILSGIVSYPDLLLVDLPKNSPLRNPLMTIHRSGQKAAAIVQDLLTLARSGLSVAEAVDLRRVVDEYLESPEFRKMISYHSDIDIHKSYASDLWTMAGSSVHLAKVIMNIVVNAAEAMPQGGDITISLENGRIRETINGYETIPAGDYVVLKISDTGIGISLEERDRIFEPFFTKKEMGRSGTGLGMSVVWGTLKDHKGYVDIMSREQEGTTLALYFPADHRLPVTDQKKPNTMATYKSNGERVLVVDDVAEQRQITAAMLEKLGYSVDTVPSGEAAVDYLEHRPVDMVILDMIMSPGMDGYDTYKNITSLYPGQKAIIASGYAETERVQAALKLGAGGFIRKPYTMEQIGAAIKEELNPSFRKTLPADV